MKINFSERVIEILRGSPNGLTSKDIADRLGTTAGNISSRLSKLAAYGIIGKARSKIVNRGSRGETVYRALNHEPRAVEMPDQMATAIAAGIPAVSGHYQTNPNSTQLDNLGTRGTLNPYTGSISARGAPIEQGFVGSTPVTQPTRCSSQHKAG